MFLGHEKTIQKQPTMSIIWVNLSIDRKALNESPEGIPTENAGWLETNSVWKNVSNNRGNLSKNTQEEISWPIFAHVQYIVWHLLRVFNSNQQCQGEVCQKQDINIIQNRFESENRIDHSLLFSAGSNPHYSHKF